jgi:hypothetical protein
MDRVGQALDRFRRANRNQLTIPFGLLCKQAHIDPPEGSARLRYAVSGPKKRYR